MPGNFCMTTAWYLINKKCNKNNIVKMAVEKIKPYEFLVHSSRRGIPLRMDVESLSL